jgi:multiple sugar transport system permease protein
MIFGIKLQNANKSSGFLFVLPALIFMSFFIIYPILSNIILSLQEVTVMTLSSAHKPFTGFENYLRLFQDPVLRLSIFNTLLFTLGSLVFQFIFGLLLALLFNTDFSIAKPIRGILIIPWMIPITITALMFKFMFTSNVGIINQILISMKIISAPIDWLISTNTAMSALIITNIWIGIPFNMILLSVGLTTIPNELYESSSIDGAGKLQSFFKITLPLLKPTIESVLILGFIYTFKVFDLVFVMTGGGPVNTTQVLSTYSYKLSFSLFRYSDGAAVANILFLILFIASLVYLKFINTDNAGNGYEK